MFQIFSILLLDPKKVASVFRSGGLHQGTRDRAVVLSLVAPLCVVAVLSFIADRWHHQRHCQLELAARWVVVDDGYAGGQNAIRIGLKFLAAAGWSCAGGLLEGWWSCGYDRVGTQEQTDLRRRKTVANGASLAPRVPHISSMQVAPFSQRCYSRERSRESV